MALHVFNFQHILQDSRSSLGQPVHTAPQPATTFQAPSSRRVAGVGQRAHSPRSAPPHQPSPPFVWGAARAEEPNNWAVDVPSFFLGWHTFNVVFLHRLDTRMRKPRRGSSMTRLTSFHDCHPGCSIEEIPRHTLQIDTWSFIEKVLLTVKQNLRKGTSALQADEISHIYLVPPYILVQLYVLYIMYISGSSIQFCFYLSQS